MYSSPRIKSTSPPTSSSPCSAPSPSLTTSWQPGLTFRPGRFRAASTTSSATRRGRGPPVRSTSADQPLISTKAQFSYGAHVGARPKQTPEYIGATNRANRRRARLAEQDDLIAAAAGEERTLAEQADRAAAEHEDFRRARRELPDTRPVAKAAETASTQAALLARSREDAETARQPPSTAPWRRPTRAPASSGRPPPSAACRPTPATSMPSPEPPPSSRTQHPTCTRSEAALVRAEEDLAERSEAVERQRLEYERAGTALEEGRARCRPPSMRSSAPGGGAADGRSARFEQIRQTERDLKAAQGRLPRATTGEPGRSTTRSPRPTGTCTTSASRWPTPSASSSTRPARSASSPDRTCAPSLGSSAPRRALAGPRRLAESRAGERRSRRRARRRSGAAAAAAGSGEADPASRPGRGLRAILPAAATEILDAFAAATRGGRQVTEGALKNTADRMSVALKDFTDALAACEEDYRVDWEPGAGLVIVNVIDDEGRKPVAGFATTNRRARQGPGSPARGPGAQGPRGRAAGRAGRADPRAGSSPPAT